MLGVNIETTSINVPAILTSAGTALAANQNRKGWTIVNLGTNALYVCMGTTASTTVFHIPLKAGTGNDDGTGGACGQEVGVIYQGIITVAGTSPRFVVTEF